MPDPQIATADRPAAHPFVVALIAFFTLVDLFATQAILPLLAHRYGASPGVIGVAVNASTFGMAIGAFATAVFGRTLDRGVGIRSSLVLLAAPTALLALAPNLAVFAALRVAQGLCMSTAFTLMLAYLGDVSPVTARATRFAAYISGNVASNLFGRMIAAYAAGMLGVTWNFVLFCGLNLLGAVLASRTIRCNRRPSAGPERLSEQLAAVVRVLGNRSALFGLGVGFCILFAFIGVFSYVNFVLMAPAFGLSMMSLGGVYLVFLPSLLTTTAAGVITVRIGARNALWLGLATAGVGLALLAASKLTALLIGLSLVGVGTFFAQAAATGYVSQASPPDTRSVASGLYLAAYFSGGLVGAAVVGEVFEVAGWIASLEVVGVFLGLAAALGLGFGPARAVAVPEVR